MLNGAFAGVVFAATATLLLSMLLVLPAPVLGQESLGFGDEVSVEVTRANQTNTETPSEEQQDPPSGCLIATAAFGSELTPQVQFLRDFRDHRILSTASGSNFMNVFNAWYYSFSPSVADYEREQPWLQTTVKASIYPLFGILHVAEKGYGLAEGEGGSLLAGFAASSLIGMVYLSPVAIALRKRAGTRKLVMPLAMVLVGALVMIAAGAASENSSLLMFSTALFVLSSMGIGIIAVMHLAKIIEGKIAKKSQPAN